MRLLLAVALALGLLSVCLVLFRGEQEIAAGSGIEPALRWSEPGAPEGDDQESVLSRAESTLPARQSAALVEPTVSEGQALSSDPGKTVHTRSLGGRITRPGGEPVSEVIIQAFSTDPQSRQRRARAHSDEEGRFHFTDLQDAAYTLFVDCDAYEPWRRIGVEVGRLDLSIVLTPRPCIRGVVKDKEQGIPLEAFTVRLRQVVPQSKLPLPVRGSRISVHDPEGAFRLPVPQEGTYLVEALAEDYAMCFSSEVRIANQKGCEGVEVNMTRGGSIVGVVLDAQGRPLPDAVVTTRDKSWSGQELTRSLGMLLPTLAVERTASTDVGGRFHLQGLTPTEYQLEVGHPGHAPTVHGVVRVEEGRPTEAGTVQLRIGGSISGIVRDPDGQVVPQAIIMLWRSLGRERGMVRSESTTTDSEGRYELRHVPAGSYIAAVRPSSRGALGLSQDEEDAEGTQRQVLVLDDKHVAFRRLHPRRVGGLLRIIFTRFLGWRNLDRAHRKGSTREEWGVGI